MSAKAEIVQRAHRALNDGDLEALSSVCDPRFQLDMSDRVLNPAVYDGHDGIGRFYAEVTEIWESFTWEVIDLHELDDLVVAVVHSSGKGRGSGVELDRRSAMIWRFENDRALSLTFYRDPERALSVARSKAESE
jgi:ketosteroid isomerase-like protein